MPVYPGPTIDPGDPGALITGDFQYEFRGLLFGAGTPIVVEKVTGLLGHAKTRSDNVKRNNGHGSLPGLLTYEERTIQFDLKMASASGAAELEENLDLLSNAFQVPRLRETRTLDVFAYKRPGRPLKCFFVRATNNDFDSDYNFGRGLAEGSVELVANDPVAYGMDLHSEAMTLGIGVTTDDMIVENFGNFRDGTPALIFVTGPCVNPIIQNVTDDNRAIRIQAVLPGGYTLRINTETWEVATSSGGPFVENYGIVKNDNQYWRLLPGNNQIVYSRTGSASASTCTVQYLDAWSRG